jgi:hypothetical protein
MSNKWLIGATSALVVALVTRTPLAAPITNPADLAVTAGEASIINEAASRRCWWHNGKRHCARYSRPHAYRYRNTETYEEFIAEKRPFGTSSWWEQMQRENRAGNPGGGGRN